ELCPLARAAAPFRAAGGRSDTDPPSGDAGRPRRSGIRFQPLHFFSWTIRSESAKKGSDTQIPEIHRFGKKSHDSTLSLTTGAAVAVGAPLAGTDTVPT